MVGTFNIERENILEKHHGLLMVGTFNIEKENLLEKHHNLPNSPLYKGGRNQVLTTSEWGKEMEGKTDEEWKDFEKKNSRIIFGLSDHLKILIFRVETDNGSLCSISFGKLFGVTFLACWGEVRKEIAASTVDILEYS